MTLWDWVSHLHSSKSHQRYDESQKGGGWCRRRWGSGIIGQWCSNGLLQILLENNKHADVFQDYILGKWPHQKRFYWFIKTRQYEKGLRKINPWMHSRLQGVKNQYCEESVQVQEQLCGWCFFFFFLSARQVLWDVKIHIQGSTVWQLQLHFTPWTVISCIKSKC